MKIIRKLSVATLAFMLTVLGLYAFAPEGTEVSAADSTQANGTVFAGYYDEATFETPSSVKTNHAKYVDSSVLGVKVQTKTNDDGTTDMRVISTVDSLNYANVGFDIWFAKEGVAIDTSKKPVNYETTVVLERIRATGNKVAYNYSPKVMDTESLYFITGTITKIKTETNQGSNFLIRPYWTTYDGTKVYGESKCVAIEDAANNNINMTVRTANPGNAKTVAVNIAGTQKEAEVVFWEDGYACVNIPVEDKTKLSSASLVEIAEGCECKLDNAKEVYRNLETAYTGTADTTWYSVYHTLGETEFVIVTSADLYGFADIVNNETDSFADKTVYQVADIELNANAKNNYSSWTGSTKPSNTKWTPIGIQTNDKSKAFKGTFDGQDHAIVGLYMYTGSQSEQGEGYYHSGLFGQPVDATIKNIRLLHSYVNNRAYIGAIAGRAYNVTFENIYTNARLGGRQDIGGIVGTLAGGKVINCWFDGSIEATADLDSNGYAHCGGIVGSIYTAESTIASCLNTGTINSKGVRTGGFLGYLDQSIRLNLSDSLSLKGVTCEKVNHVGAAIGQVPGVMLYVDKDSVYATEPTLPEGATIRAIGTGFSGKVNTLDGTQVNVDNNYIPFASSVSLKGMDAYINTGIVFDRPETEDIEEGYWVTTETHPILGSFKDLVKDEYVVTDAIAGTFRTDTSWVKFPKTESFGESEVNTYTIDRPEELLGLAKLVNDGTNDFSGDIIYLNEDIIFNVGDAKDWEQGKKTENLYGDWTPIGWTNDKDNLSRFFKGTFDGQGHTISGLYISDETKNYTGWHLGLFGYVTDATITDVRLQNSFFRGGSRIGSFASVSNNSKFQNLYSDAILEAKYSDSRAGQTGGIVSTMNGGTEGELTNCWFAGKVTSGSYGRTGGLIGLIPDGTSVAITGCLNSSTVYSTGDRVGGFIGYMEHTTGSPAEVRIKDSLNIGDISSSKDIGSGKIGAVIGEMDALLWVEQASVHTTQSELKYAFGNDFGGTLYDIKAEETSIKDDQNNYIPFSTVESMSGLLSKFNTGLSFDNSETDEVEGYWTATEKTPVLAQFAELGEAKELSVLTSWAENPIVENIDGEDVNTYTINSLGELLGFVQLVNSGDNTFSDEIVYLDKDIVVNKGDAEDWAKGENTENLIAWVPIGTSANKFAGTFDGKGHSISGIYLNASTQSLQGLFSITSTGAVLQNFSLLNSYISGYDDTGAIVGKLVGTVQSVYNEAFVAGRNKVGGLVGTVDGMSDISSCWNAGNIKAGDGTTSGAYVGGIVGYINAGETNISHCLNTGNIHFGNQQAGGIVGQVYSATTINDCLNIGKITTGHTNGVTKRNAGSVVGYHVDGILTISSTYGYAENSIGVSSGYDGGKVAGEEIVGSATKITDCTTFYDASALVSNKLDYHFWTARKAAVPVPTGVAHTIDSSDIFAINTSWDSGNETNITLSNMADLYGFALLSQSKNFAGYTFTLSKNIVVNDDSITEETNKETLIDWIPIGNKDNIFAGNFDGAGHSISGVYAKGTSNIGLFYATTGTLMDFRLENSWFEGSGNYVASVVANYATGTIEKVYSNATVRSKGEVVGGLVGSVNANGKLTMSECWFAGSVKATGFAGTPGPGYEIGGLVGEVKDKCTLELTHTLNTGSVYSNGKRVGGLIGAVTGTGQASISDSLNAGKTEGLDYVGTIIGYISESSTIDLGTKTTYGINDYASTPIGKKEVVTNDEDVITQQPTIAGNVQLSTIKDRLIGYAGTTAGLDFTTYWSLMNKGTPVLNAFVGEGKVVAKSEVYDGSGINTLLQLTYWDKTIANAEDKGTGNYMVTVENPVLGETNGTTTNSYYGYLAALGGNGFTAYANDNGLNDEGVYNAIYTKGLDTTETVSDDWVVNVTYISYKEDDNVTPKIYITFSAGQPLSKHLKAADVVSVNYSATDGYSVAQDNVTFSMLESSYEKFGAGSYVMQLKNGHFIIIDGGILTDVEYLFKYLESLAVDAEGNQLKPIVEAWVFSHSHSDHMGSVLGIMKDIDSYKDRIYVEGFYYNEPNGEIVEAYGKGSSELTNALKNCASQVLKTTQGNVPQIYRMQTGQRYTFDGVEMDIMLSQELLTVADYEATGVQANSYQMDSFNDTSTWCMFTIREGDDAQKLFTGADGSYSGKNYICDIYSSDCLTVDVMTALHHGLNTNMSDYKNMNNELLSQPKQEEFSEKVKVTSVVLYSYKYDMCQKETNATLPNGNQAVNWAYAKLNKSFIEHLASKSDTFRDGILVNNNGTEERKNYLYFGEGACKLTFHGDTITATVAPFTY